MASLPNEVRIVEVGPRDGLQNEQHVISTEKKIAMINMLSRCGFKNIEATSFVSPKRVPQLADAGQVLTGIDSVPRSVLSCAGPKYEGIGKCNESWG